MRFLTSFLVLCIALLGCTRAVEQSKSESEPAGIISLSPSITETIYAFGGGDQVIGVDRFSNQIPAADADLKAKRIKLFGDAASPESEAIIYANPEYILVEGDTRSTALKAIGPNVEALPSQNLEQILAMWDRVGVILDARAKAEAAQEAFQSLLQPEVDFEAPPRALVTYSSPDQGTLYCVGKDSYQSEILVKLGMRNVLDSLTIETPTPQVSLEDLLVTHKPDLIITILASPAARSAQERWAEVPTLAAVKNGKVYDLAGSQMTFYGPESLLAFTKALRGVIRQYAGR